MRDQLKPPNYPEELVRLAEARQIRAFETLRMNGEKLDDTIKRFTPETPLEDYRDVWTWDVNRLIHKVRFSKYEDSKQYSLYQIFFQIAVAQILAEKGEPERWPMLVTLPSGDLNAYAELDPIEEYELVFVERGMLDFLVNACRLAGWLLPEGPITVDKGQHTTSMEASAALHSLVVNYAVNGTPGPSIDLLPNYDVGSISLNKLLLPRATSFLLMHELAHTKFGHTDSLARFTFEAHEREYQCDAEAFRGIYSASHSDEREYCMPFFVCDTFLCALNALVQTISRLWLGHWNIIWESTTHPPP